MASAMRHAVLALATITCLALPAAAGAALPAPQPGKFGADGSFRPTGTQVNKPGQTVAVLGTYRIVDDEVIGQENCPSTGLNRIQGLLPGATVAASVVQWNWAARTNWRVQLANRAFKCGNEVRAELELYAQVDRVPNQACILGPITGNWRDCRIVTPDDCEFRRYRPCPIRITGEIRLYEGTSDTTNKLRAKQAVNLELVGGTFVEVPEIFGYFPGLPGGKSADQRYQVKWKGGDSVTMNLQFSVQPTVILQ